jgi:DNA (cytosine-5)-methyltransferase 1
VRLVAVHGSTGEVEASRLHRKVSFRSDPLSLFSLTPRQSRLWGSHSESFVDARAVELFAGVGGFRLGLQRAGWDVVWSNQWEPVRRKQWASECYVSHFGSESHSNEDITTVPARRIPRHELLVGGFPCQDYSVATTLSRAAGLQGKKGVLWWEIYRIAKAKRPPYLLLENVDRLLRSPHTQRGRDFGVMLWCLNSLGYAVEWRVVNAADYGEPQKRRRIFILAAKKSTLLGRRIAGATDKRSLLLQDGFFASEFPVTPDAVRAIATDVPHAKLPRTAKRTSEKFELDFRNSGTMANGKIWTYQVKPKADPHRPLGSILQQDVDERFFIPDADVETWKKLKGAKSLKRTRNGFVYHYSEGAIPFPDRLDQPARTIVTGEGGISPSRFKHLVLDPQRGRYRVLTPVECERLNGFPEEWTKTGMPESWRYFTMGNALVVGLVERMATRLKRLANEQPHETSVPATIRQEALR